MAALEDIREGAKVIGAQGKSLGKVVEVNRDPGSGTVIAFVVESGIWRFGSRRKVSADVVRDVNSDGAVVIRMTKDEFSRLPKLAEATA